MNLSSFLDKTKDFIQFAAIVFLITMVLFGILSSQASINYLANKMARTSKDVTHIFKQHGMDKAIVEGKLSLGLLTFKVTAEDESN